MVRVMVSLGRGERRPSTATTRGSGTGYPPHPSLGVEAADEVDKEGGSAPWLLAMILFTPCLILIDHGHFQPWINAAILSRNEVAASALFSLAINHKQMSLYFCTSIFSHLLGKCLRHHDPIFEVMKVGFVVMGTFALVWWPYLYSLEAVME
ncbi:probable dolichyl pyrophosphate Man9GlcNAc2 alpha-1,3-glucosyltransferase [Phoenix dactylifera]|uniref:Alpha-1,3-glucosyltransferase n=1 Tax=Phoenix dactylifera TaxID=42345 RepID=A0A8B9A3Z2_PHODC|nr:probable dolichyl pyrophosphate Man9GlcNAc2 alpha-1,3-glucosyltransferase [Phoenix dactylifera]